MSRIARRMADITFLDLPEIKVTTATVVVGRTTYAVANITSTRTAELDGTRWTGVIIAVVGALSVAVGISNGSPQAIVIGVVLALVGGLMAYYGLSHELVITTGAAEQHALQTRDKGIIERASAAVNAAIASRHAAAR